MTKKAVSWLELKEYIAITPCSTFPVYNVEQYLPTNSSALLINPIVLHLLVSYCRKCRLCMIRRFVRIVDKRTK